MGKLEGKVAIITGAASGIGKASAVLFAKEGAKVVVADIQDELGKETVKKINDTGGKAVYVHTDVSKADDVKNMIKTAVDTYGKLDILYNNAGTSGIMADTLNYPVNLFENVIAINLLGTWYGIKYALPELLKTGAGIIINTASVAGFTAPGYMMPYGASKAGVVSITKGVALEYADSRHTC